MGRWKTYTGGGEKAIHEEFLDYRSYDTYAETVAATVGWGFNETGRILLCLATGSFYYWNGAALVIWPSTGGAGAPVDKSYVTTADESAVLTGSVRHSTLTNAGGFLHECLLHAPTHLHDGTDPLNVHDISGKLADEQNAGWVKGVVVDDSTFGVGKFLAVAAGPKLMYFDLPGGGDMTQAVYDPDADNVVESADNADTVDGSHAAAFAAATHKDTHKTGGGANAFLVTDLLDAIARVTARANSGANVGSRRRLNFLNGTNTTWTVSDVGASEEMTIRVDAPLTGIVYKLSPSYTIYTIGGNIYAMDEDGGIPFGGADAYTVIQAVLDALGATDGGLVYICNGVYDIHGLLRPYNNQTIEGESKYYTILRPGDAAHTPLISLNRTIGTANRMEKVTIRNLKIDMRDYAASRCIELYNIKDSRFQQLWLKGWKEAGMYFEADSVGFSFYNTIYDILTDASVASGKALFDFYSNFLDNNIDLVTGTVTGGLGMKMDGVVNLNVSRMHLVGCENVIKIHADNGTVGIITVRESSFDTPTDHSIYIDRTAGSNTIKDLYFLDNYFVGSPANHDLLYIDTTSADINHIEWRGNKASSGCAHRYIVQVAGGNAVVDSLFTGNHIQDGSSGSYTGVPLRYIVDDHTYLRRQIKLMAGVKGDLATAGTEYIHISGQENANGTEVDTEQVLNEPGILANLYVYLEDAPAGVTTRTFTVRKNHGNTTITTTITGAATTGEDTTHYVAFAKGDRLCYSSTVGGVPVACRASLTLDYFTTP